MIIILIIKELLKMKYDNLIEQQSGFYEFITNINDNNIENI